MTDIHKLLLEHIGVAFAVFGGLFSVVGMLALVWLKRHFPTLAAYDKRNMEIDALFANHEERLKQCDEQIVAIRESMGMISGVLSGLPRREDIMKLDLDIAELRGDTKEVNASVNGLRDIVERQEGQTALLHQHLLRKEK